ncbi:hypothetical protein BSL78_19233 [Apostichopus japonicus]|uniref:Phospholipid scramblase n=1 Tax=Stichopus japonicus TaxID=307972 RepID=A0A2G8K7H4_STIJA|nr:hypothetical protein BSL78_19233 [Apostichopus japonicus]
MGASQSLWAITGNPPTCVGEQPPSYEIATIPGLLPGLEGLVNLDVYKIDEKSTFGSSFKVHDSSGVIVYHAQHVSSSVFANNLYREVFRVNDFQKRGALRVFDCVAGIHYNTPSSLPGVLIGYVKITKETLSNPQYEILNENGESVLLVRPVSGSKYNVFSQGGNYRIGEFCPRMTSGIKGSFPRDLDVRMKAGVLLTAVVICRKRAKERRS